jgi:hypothetical protein
MMTKLSEASPIRSMALEWLRQAVAAGKLSESEAINLFGCFYAAFRTATFNALLLSHGSAVFSPPHVDVLVQAMIECDYTLDTADEMITRTTIAASQAKAVVH